MATEIECGFEFLVKSVVRVQVGELQDILHRFSIPQVGWREVSVICRKLK